jgi:LysM repeat protein
MRHRTSALLIAGLVAALLLPVLLTTAQETEGDTPADDTVLPITEDVIYVVRPVDTLDSIGAIFDVQLGCVARMNELNNKGQLVVGQELLISVSCPSYDGDRAVAQPRQLFRGPVECPNGYVVQASDTLDVIGQTLDVSVVSLQIANQIEAGGREVKIGMCLAIPPDAPAYGVYPALDTPTDTTLGQGGAVIEGEQYVVQPLDTLDVIGQQFNVSVVSLQQANGIGTARDMTPGKTIVIPADAPPYGTFPALCPPYDPLQPGDCSDNDLTAGQGGGAAGEVYVVQPRDTIDLIAARFDKDVACILEQNQLEKKGLVYAGQALLLGDDCPSYVGDSVIPPLASAVRPADSADTQAAEPQATSEPSDGG